MGAQSTSGENTHQCRNRSLSHPMITPICQNGEQSTQHATDAPKQPSSRELTLQVGHVLAEAYTMGAIVVTGVPHAYSGHPELAVQPLDNPPAGGPVRPA